MPQIDDYENEVLSAFGKCTLKSVASKAELAKFKAAARVTARHEAFSGASRSREARRRGPAVNCVPTRGAV